VLEFCKDPKVAINDVEVSVVGGEARAPPGKSFFPAGTSSGHVTFFYMCCFVVTAHTATYTPCHNATFLTGTTVDKLSSTRFVLDLSLEGVPSGDEIVTVWIRGQRAAGAV
jgi:hypothetical protein